MTDDAADLDLERGTSASRSPADKNAGLEAERIAVERQRLRLERQKAVLEYRLRRQELAKPRGQGFREYLSNPLTLAIVGAFLTLMTTIISNLITAKMNAEAAKQTLQADLIKKFVEAPRTEIVRENLRFLVDAGLLPDYASNITTYLDKNPDAAPQVGNTGNPVPIIGRGFTPAEFRSYVATLTFDNWRPEFVVLHNTVAPSLTQWHQHPAEQSLQHFAQFFGGLGWQGGPHLFIDDTKIWVFNSLEKPGIHDPSWNKISIGIEIVGDYNTEAFDDRVRENTVQAVAILDRALNLKADTLRFASEDPRSTHKDNPGKNVVKEDLIQQVNSAISKL